MSRIYFPLRTNVHYADLQPLDLELESRIKLSALLYDELIFEDGVYHALIGPRYSLTTTIPVSQFPKSALEDEWPLEGGVFTLEFGGLRVEDRALRRYNFCFRPLLEKAGLMERSWVRFSEFQLKDDAKQYAKELSERDFQGLGNGARATYLLTMWAIEGLNHDSLLAHLLGWDLNLDPLHEELVRRKMNDSAKSKEACPGGETLIVHPPVDFEWVFPLLPDMPQVPWEQVLKLRDSDAAVEFRKRFTSATREAKKCYLEGVAADAVRYKLAKFRDEQVLDELESSLPSKRKILRENLITIVVTVIGFLPIVGTPLSLVDAARSIASPWIAYAERRKSLAAAFVRRRRRQP